MFTALYGGIYMSFFEKFKKKEQDRQDLNAPGYL